MASGFKYRRIILKLSGEIFGGSLEFGIDTAVVKQIAEEIKEVKELGVEVGIVVGAGNIFRGKELVEEGMSRVVADYTGMIATMINSLVLQSILEQIEVPTRVMTAIEMKEVAEPYIRRRAMRHLEKGRVVIFSCGTGNPYFTTDTAAALRAAEIEAEVILKGTKVKGVYSADPVSHPDAEFFPEITFTEALSRKLEVMDATAFSLCRENRTRVIVFDLMQQGNIKRILDGEHIGTLMRSE